MWQQLKRNGFTVYLENPEIYVNNQARGRSGHMSHAMAEFAPDTFIDFNSNCSAVRSGGHSQYGWIEYRISKDAGLTYSEVRELPFAKKAFNDGIFSVSLEKAVGCDDGSIVALCIRNDMLFEVCCEPWFTPMAVKSRDGGDTWSEPIEVSEFKGRIYDAVYRDGVIYFLIFCNDGTTHFCGNKPEHIYRIYQSCNNGESFECLCEVPFESTEGRGYGSLLFDESGRLHVYAYNENAERHMEHITTDDLGKTWTQHEPCYVAKGIRNPQTAILDGVYILHGRGEEGHGFVLYTSVDGFSWDEGFYLEKDKECCYYSNNILLSKPDGGKRLLIQYSDTYGDEAAVNVMHMWLEIRR